MDTNSKPAYSFVKMTRLNTDMTYDIEAADNATTYLTSQLLIREFNVQSTDSLRYSNIVLKITKLPQEVCVLEKQSIIIPVDYKLRADAPWLEMDLGQKFSVTKGTENFFLRIFNYEFCLTFDFVFKQEEPAPPRRKKRRDPIMDEPSNTPAQEPLSLLEVRKLLRQQNNLIEASLLNHEKPNRKRRQVLIDTEEDKEDINEDDEMMLPNSEGEEEKSNKKDDGTMMKQGGGDRNSSLNSTDDGGNLRAANFRRLRKGFPLLIESSSNTDCPICLDPLPKDIGKLPCAHTFCLSCIQSWKDSTNLCPLCKQSFLVIEHRDKDGPNQTLIARIDVKPKKLDFADDNADDGFIYDRCDDDCYECNRPDDEANMLICDTCNFYCCHIQCLNPPLDAVPEGNWQCKFCDEIAEMEQNENGWQRALGVRPGRSRNAVPRSQRRATNRNRPDITQLFTNS